MTNSAFCGQRSLLNFCLIGAGVLAGTNSTLASELETAPCTIAMLHEYSTYDDLAMSSNGRDLLLTGSTDDVKKLHVVNWKSGAARQLNMTDGGNLFAVSWFPKDGRMLFRTDGDGTELDRLGVRSTDGSWRLLDERSRAREVFLRWSADGEVFWTLSNERDPYSFDVVSYRSDDYSKSIVFENTERWGVNDISPDGRWVALRRIIDNRRREIYLWDSSTPSISPRLISPHKSEGKDRILEFSRDSRYAYYVTNLESEFFYVSRYNLLENTHSIVLESGADATDVRFSTSGRYVAFHFNRDAASNWVIFDAYDAKVVGKVKPDASVSTDLVFLADETGVVFVRENPSTPPQLSFSSLTGEVGQLPQPFDAAIPEHCLSEARRVTYPSDDNLEIPAILYSPRVYAENMPAVIWLHGGPGGQSRMTFNSYLQSLANGGYAVLAINNRGSSGYGKTFHHLDDRQHGVADVKDVLAARKYLQTLSHIDPDRIAVAGQSYGGFLTLASLITAPDAFQAGVDIFGVTNWVRLLKGIPSWWAERRAEFYAEIGDPKADKEMLNSRSPLMNAAKIKAPLLVIQGANDPRVPVAESDDLVAALQARDVPVEYLVFENEGHGFSRRTNQIRASETTLRFLDEHVRGIEPGEER